MPQSALRETVAMQEQSQQQTELHGHLGEIRGLVGGRQRRIGIVEQPTQAGEQGDGVQELESAQDTVGQNTRFL